MHDFIQTSNFTHHYILIIFAVIGLILSIYLIYHGIFRDRYSRALIPFRIMFIVWGTAGLCGTLPFLHTISNGYAEYTGIFKVVDSTTNRIYENSKPTIVVKDKQGNEQAVPVSDGKIYHKGDIAKVKILAIKNIKPSLDKKITINSREMDPSREYKQVIKSVEKVK